MPIMLQTDTLPGSHLKAIILAALLVATTLIWPYSSARAGSVLEIDADRQFKFAEHYFSNEEYFRAIGEYKRFIYFFPDDNRVELARFQSGMAFFLSRRFREAVDSFRLVINTYDDSKFALKSYFMISECHMRLKQFGPAVTTLFNLITISGNIQIQDEAYYRLGWIYIETASWEKARKYFGKISNQNKEKFRLKKLADELDKERQIAKKDPRLAGFLSIIPGGGYLYNERYQDALIAFLLNGGLIWAAYEAFDNDNDALGAIISFVEVGFYAGNIYGAASSAHKYNRNKTEQFIENLKKNTKIQLSAGFQSKKIQLSFQFAF